MTLIRDVLEHDPVEWSIPNDGVAKVGPPETDHEWNVLNYELRSFVAQGEYEAGLERILSSFLTHLDRDTQPAAWVSGFFGSGKSHLVKALAAFWTDVTLPDGARATSLAHLPPSVSSLLTELRTRGSQFGGRFAAAGTLSAGGTSAALSFLSIVFAASRLPDNYAAARLVLWLKREGMLEPVTAHLASTGRELADELLNMYVSEHLASAILAASPGFAPTTAAVRAAIQQQFPSVESLTDAEFIDVLGETLRMVGDGVSMPLTLIVLDELQQFLNDDPVRTLEVQQLVEQCCSKFGSRLLFVATGQMALGATPALQKLQDRFRVEVALRDTDVDRVVRSVVLRKKPDREPELRAVLDRASGEISRQLAGSAIGSSASDGAHLVADYPLLPTRRRFWDAVIRAMDTAGRSMRLRTQLRNALEATRDVADRDLGVVVPADEIYDLERDEYLGTGALPRDTAGLIDELDDGIPSGRLESRVAKLVFLIGRLPKEGAKPTGVLSTSEAIVDLLVADLHSDRAKLAAQVPEAIAHLVQRGALIGVGGGQYLLQTPTGAEWSADFEMYRRELEADDAWLASRRADELRGAFERVTKALRPLQGESKVARKLRLFFGDANPKPQEDEVAVWARSGWDVAERVVIDRARSAGVTSATVFIYVPRARAEDLKSALIEAEAAHRTVDRRPAPTTEEGMQARAGLATRRDIAKAEKLPRIIEEILRGARVFQGGGAEIAEPASDPTLSASIARAVDNAVLRLYPEYGMADSKSWARVVDIARQGNPNPLRPLQYNGEVEEHPVPKAILSVLPPSGKRGQEIRRTFLAPPYGWPQDAIDGSLLALTSAGKIEARHNGVTVGPKQIPQNVLGVVEFRPQTVTIKVQHKLAVKSLAQELGVRVQSVDEVDLPRLVLDRLHDLAMAAGGDAPLPARPSVERLRDLEAMSGAAQFVAVADATEELKALAVDWRTSGELAPSRLAQWQQALKLLVHARNLPLHDTAESRLNGVDESRSLLAEPDPVAPVVGELCDALRMALTRQWSEYDSTRSAAVSALGKSPDWSALDSSEQEEILVAERLNGTSPPPLGTVSELLGTLDDVPLSDWQFRIQAIEAQTAKALAAAVSKRSKETVEIYHELTVIHDVPELERHLKRVREEVTPYLDDGKSVIL